MFRSPRSSVACTAAALAVGQFFLVGSPLDAQTRYTRAQDQQFHERAATALAHGRFDEAEALAATRPETDPSAVALRARMHVRRGRYAEAEQLLAPVAGDEPFGAAGLEYGLLLMGTGGAAEAGPVSRRRDRPGLPIAARTGSVSRWASRLPRSVATATRTRFCVRPRWRRPVTPRFRRRGPTCFLRSTARPTRSDRSPKRSP